MSLKENDTFLETQEEIEKSEEAEREVSDAVEKERLSEANNHGEEN